MISTFTHTCTHVKYIYAYAQIASGAIPLASALVDETTLCADAFKILQFIADNWVKDAKNYGNAHADRLQVCELLFPVVSLSLLGMLCAILVFGMLCVGVKHKGYLRAHI
jgi:hypothetical protein